METQWIAMNRACGTTLRFDPSIQRHRAKDSSSKMAMKAAAAKQRALLCIILSADYEALGLVC